MTTKKYLPVLAAFIVGMTGAAGVAAHAASVTPNPVTASTAVQSTAQDPNHVDGEQADDTNANTDVQVGHQDVGGSDTEVADAPENSVQAEGQGAEVDGAQGAETGVSESNTAQ